MLVFEIVLAANVIIQCVYFRYRQYGNAQRQALASDLTQQVRPESGSGLNNTESRSTKPRKKKGNRNLWITPHQ